MSEMCAYDLDGTIRPGSLLTDIARHGINTGLFDPNVFADLDKPSWDELPQFFEAITNCSRHDFLELTDWLTESAAQQIYPWAQERMEYQTEQGYHVVIVSHSPDFAVKALARGLDAVKHAKGTYFHTQELVFSGRNITLNKRQSITRYLHQHSLNTLNFAAGDTHHDLPMLFRAQTAAVVNPDPELAQVAEAKGWEIINT